MIARFVRLATCAAFAAAAGAACASPFAPQYEYEEQVYLSVDGRAAVVIDSSLPALAALRGLTVDEAATRESLRRLFAAAGCQVENVSRFWTRSGRKFVQIRVAVSDVKQLPACAPLAWSSYALAPIDGGGLRYQQAVGAAAAGDPGKVNWGGGELVAFKLHLPSRIRRHNVKRLDGTNGDIERGNILTWAQTLADRRAGKPIAIDVDMDETSILNTTLWLFFGAFGGAVLLLVVLIGLVVRRGRRVTRPPP